MAMNPEKFRGMQMPVQELHDDNIEPLDEENPNEEVTAKIGLADGGSRENAPGANKLEGLKTESMAGQEAKFAREVDPEQALEEAYSRRDAIEAKVETYKTDHARRKEQYKKAAVEAAKKNIDLAKQGAELLPVPTPADYGSTQAFEELTKYKNQLDAIDQEIADREQALEEKEAA